MGIADRETWVLAKPSVHKENRLAKPWVFPKRNAPQGKILRGFIVSFLVTRSKRSPGRFKNVPAQNSI
jgi:hypothetical protein